METEPLQIRLAVRELVRIRAAPRQHRQPLFRL